MKDKDVLEICYGLRY